MLLGLWQPVFVLLVTGGLGYGCMLMLLGSISSARPEPLSALARQSASDRAATRAQREISAVATRTGWQTNAALQAEALVAEQDSRCADRGHGLAAGCEWYSTAVLLPIEAAQSLTWNRSRNIVLIGLKVTQSPCNCSTRNPLPRMQETRA